MPLPILAIAGLGVTAAWSATIAALHAGKVVVPRVLDWGGFAFPIYVDPILGLATEREWRDARRLWVGVGHEIGVVSRATPAPGERCVYVRPPAAGLRAGAISSAHVSADFADEIEEEEEELDREDAHHIEASGGLIHRVEVDWDPLALIDFDRVRVAGHELGHALGFLHCTARLGRKHAATRPVRIVIPKAGNLMHPQYKHGGYLLEGCRAKPD